MINNRRNFFIGASLALAAAALFIPFLGGAHLFDWDELNFAEISREMILTGDYFRVHIDFEPFWEKPPLFFWLQSACMRLFGTNEFAARLPNALVGCVTLPTLFFVGNRLYGASFGLVWACLYAGSFLPAFYFKSGIIDPLFNLWIFLGVYWLARGTYSANEKENGAGQTSESAEAPDSLSADSSTSDYSLRSLRPIALAGLFVGLAVLTKGPVGFLLAALAWGVVWVIRRKTLSFPVLEAPFFTVVVLAVSLLWFGVELLRGGLWFFREFANYQIRLLTTGDAGHSQPIYYHFVVVFLGCFPASAFAYSAFRRQPEESAAQRHFRLWMITLLCVVLGVFSAVQTKIVHYSSLAYFPVTFLGAHTLHRALKRGRTLALAERISVAAIGTVWAALLAAVPIIALNKEKLLPSIRDAFARANLAAPVAWSGFEIAVGAGYFLAILLAVAAMAKRRYFEMTLVLVGAGALAVFSFTATIAPKIEGYTQNAVVEFYQSLRGQECYIKALGFKSYGQFFYTDKRRSQSPSGVNIPADEFERWLLEGDIDKPAYFVCKITGAEEWRKHPNLTELYERYGFVFFKREPIKKPNWAAAP